MGFVSWALGSATARYSSSGRQPNFAALNRVRHVYSAGQPSRWALAHIVFLFFSYCVHVFLGFICVIIMR